MVDIQLHGFADASCAGYGGVVYIKYLHADTSVVISLVVSKTWVAPLKQQSIPKLELSGALLLSRLLTSVPKDLNIDKAKLYAWSDSMIILGWLAKSSSRWKVYVADQVNEIQEAIPSSQWRHVSTKHNPADYASRGLSPADLIKAEFWWKGPPWLSLESLPEIRPIVNNIQLKTSDLWERLSSFDNLLRVIAWCRRFIRNCQIKVREKSPRLTSEELNSA